LIKRGASRLYSALLECISNGLPLAWGKLLILRLSVEVMLVRNTVFSPLQWHISVQISDWSRGVSYSQHGGV